MRINPLPNSIPVDPSKTANDSNTYGQSISGITSYKNNLLLTLLGDPQKPLIPLSGSNSTLNNATPVEQVIARLKQFTTGL